MKLLLFSDVHMSRDSCSRLVEFSQDVDLVIGAGDYCSLRRGLGHVIEWLSEIEKRTILVPGNAESYEELMRACQSWLSCTVLHGTGTTFEGISIYGIGGGIPVTPFGSWSYDFTEEEAEKLLKCCQPGGILISHAPPKHVLDLSSSGLHLGSTAVRRAMDEKKPELLVCGHIHESAGAKTTIGNTMVINAGPEGIFYEL